MSETIGTPPIETVHEAYAFACMRCGHGWEESYEIRHHLDENGRTTVSYHVGGARVPSPLTRPSCHSCGSHLVRIMRPGRVAGARWGRGGPAQLPAQDAQGDRALDAPAAGPLPPGPSAPHQPRHWRLADLLHLFHLPGRGHGEHATGGSDHQEGGRAA